jgi:hypothetical protein
MRALESLVEVVDLLVGEEGSGHEGLSVGRGEV